MFDLMPQRRRLGGEVIRRWWVNEVKDCQETQIDPEQEAHHEDPRKIDRRKEPCAGFTYISTVGWICRRESIRRKALNR